MKTFEYKADKIVKHSLLWLLLLKDVVLVGGDVDDYDVDNNNNNGVDVVVVLVEYKIKFQ